MGHKLDDNLLVTNHLLTRLGDEAAFESGENKGYWSARQRSNGEIISRSSGYEAQVAEQMLAKFILGKLNDEIPMDGAWIVAWTDGGSRFIMLWMDGDGDIQFTVEIDDIPTMIQLPWTHWVGQAMDAWESWHHHMREVLEPTPDALFKRAQGQAPESIRNPAQFRRN